MTMARLVTMQTLVSDRIESDHFYDLVRQTRKQADEAWTAVSEAAARGDEIDESYQRGRAHALCELLGDQEYLDRMGVS